MTTVVEIHALQNFAPSNLNRDDTGAPKDAIFGGTRRARISSQCLKRSIRHCFGQMIGNGGLNSDDDVAVRTKRLLEEIVTKLVVRGRDREQALLRVKEALESVKLKIDSDGKSEYLLYLGNREIDGIAGIVHENWSKFACAKDVDEVKASEETSSPDEAKPSEEAKKKKKSKKDVAKEANPELKRALEKILDGGRAVDLALFGRMLADLPEKSQDAACQVAHAISTHVVNREFDFYTAIDDLKPDDNSGADMMGTVEFNSACFYRYATINWEKLVSNLQGDDALGAKGVREFLRGFSVAEPTGKQNTFAAHNPPEFIAVFVRKNSAPMSLANAFETAISTKKDLTKLSAEKLCSKAEELQQAYGGKSVVFVLNLAGVSLNSSWSQCKSLEELLDGVVETIVGGKK